LATFAKVGVAGSNPVVRSKNRPLTCEFVALGRDAFIGLALSPPYLAPEWPLSGGEGVGYRSLTCTFVIRIRSDRSRTTPQRHAPPCGVVQVGRSILPAPTETSAGPGSAERTSLFDRVYLPSLLGSEFRKTASERFP
jgi:hypothetical protein